MSKIRKPRGCPLKRHDARYSVRISGGELVARKEVVGGYCAVAEINWDKSWNDLLGGRLEHKLLCEWPSFRNGLKW
jgi:hypothetical protein